MQDALCGKRGKFSFAKTPLVDTSDAISCPSGKLPCSTKGSSQDGLTYCVDQSELEACPVTELVIMDVASSLAAEYANKEGWKA